MRLTLRTLLAYRNKLLDPLEADGVRARIDKSPLANSVISRIEQAVQNSHLLSEMDPNLVANYLDNELAENVVAEYERRCLESESQLAEVVDCHEILCLVLNQPAAIPERVRQRVYDAATKNPPEVEAATNSSEELRGNLSESSTSSEPNIVRRSFPWKLLILLVTGVTCLATVAVLEGYRYTCRRHQRSAQRIAAQPTVPDAAEKNRVVQRTRQGKSKVQSDNAGQRAGQSSAGGLGGRNPNPIADRFPEVI